MAIYKYLVILKVAKIPQNQGSKLLNFLIFSCLTERFRGTPEGGDLKPLKTKGLIKYYFLRPGSFSGHSPGLINISISIFLLEKIILINI